jgi:c-di-GMP-related signal transduction protein
MCEQLAKAQGSGNSSSLFLVGLFSVLDALVDQPMGRALATLPLSSAVSEADGKQVNIPAPSVER